MKLKTRTARYADTHTFRRLNADAVDNQRNRAITDKGESILDPDGFHVVAFSMFHNEDEMRCQFLCKVTDSMEPVELWLDMDIDEYFELPKVAAE